jgi:hypothetical protein
MRSHLLTQPFAITCCGSHAHLDISVSIRQLAAGLAHQHHHRCHGTLGVEQHRNTLVPNNHCSSN